MERVDLPRGDKVSFYTKGLLQHAECALGCSKIRASLGLKPLVDDRASNGSTSNEAEENFRKHREAEDREKEQKALQERLAKKRNQRERAKRLIGASLGDDEDEDARDWVKRQRKAARRQIKAVAPNSGESPAAADYSENDLAGIKVAHLADEFGEDEETILTLKDSRVLDDEEDELHNVNMTENSKHVENVEQRKKGRQQRYTGYDDEEFAEGATGPGASRKLLSKYDEELYGKGERSFRLGGDAGPSSAASAAPAPSTALEASASSGPVKLDLDFSKHFGADYAREGDAEFKIPKRKKKRAGLRGKQATDADVDADGDAAMGPAPVERADLSATNLIDDDELQSALGRARREQARRRIVQQKAQFQAPPPPPPADEDEDVDKEDDAGELVLDDTSEFARNISLAPEAPPVKREMRSPASPAIKAESSSAGPRQPVAMQAEAMDEDVKPVLDGAVAASSDEDDADADEAGVPGEAGDFGREQPVSGGLAATLHSLRSQGLIKEATPEERERETAARKREAFLAGLKRTEYEREMERQRSRQAGGSKDQSQREYENRMREQEEARRTMDLYKDYNPNVDIKYHDEYGRDMTPHEAWKQLAHNFHGYGSGMKKHEKRLKKIEDERKRAAMASGDTPLSSAAAFAARAERTGSATMVLGVRPPFLFCS